MPPRFPFQLPVKTPEKLKNNGSNTWVTVTHLEDLGIFPASSLGWIWARLADMVTWEGNQRMKDTCFFFSHSVTVIFKLKSKHKK